MRRMNKTLDQNRGFTIVEALISLAIVLVFLPFAASMLSNSQLLASYSKHKIEAAYAAQQIIETQRQQPFQVIATGKSVVNSNFSVILDTKGEYNNPTCANPDIFCGGGSITLTPTVYTNSAGTKTTSTTTDHMVVAITWTEQFFNLKSSVTETYAADIVNDPMFN